jgi:hypothetical protein
MKKKWMSASLLKAEFKELRSEGEAAGAFGSCGSLMSFDSTGSSDSLGILEMRMPEVRKADLMVCKVAALVCCRALCVSKTLCFNLAVLR